jgi:hypothetical protein
MQWAGVCISSDALLLPGGHFAPLAVSRCMVQPYSDSGNVFREARALTESALCEVILVCIWNCADVIAGKALFVTGRESLWGCETPRPTLFLENRLTDRGDISLTRRPAGLL